MKKAMIAMSGGVDSSVAALLLLKAGYDVTGMTMRLRPEAYMQQSASGGCCSLDDIDDARRVCYQLGIDHLVLNFTEQFERDVIQYFAEQYAAGRTPNPCIACNRHLKFDAMLQKARLLGFDFIATGHYAVITQNDSGRWLLKRAPASKDQSYVLYAMTQDQLAHTLFPLGGYTKKEIRHIAQEQGFINADKPDSQDICFVPDGDYASFIEQYTGQSSEPGDFVDKEGKVLGKHKGQIHYTIGQRRGLGISAPESLYVCGKSLDSNEVILGGKQDLMSNYCYINDINLIPWDHLDAPIKCKVKTRYRQPEQPATVEQIGEDLIKITFDEPQRAVTPGQAAVLYDDDMVLGGGTILPEGLASTMTTSQGTNN